MHTAAVTLLEHHTATVPHLDRTLFVHLLGTYNWLKKNGFPEYICLAGLYHSIYETEYFEFNTTFTRPVVASIIGQDAEHLVYEFCNTRPRTTNLIERNGTWSDQTYADLLDIDIANMKEQGYYNDTIKTMEAIRKHLVIRD